MHGITTSSEHFPCKAHKVMRRFRLDAFFKVFYSFLWSGAVNDDKWPCLDQEANVIFGNLCTKSSCEVASHLRKLAVVINEPQLPCIAVS